MKRPLTQAVVHDGPAGAWSAALVVASSTLLATLVLVFRFSVAAPTLRATVETALTLFGLVTARLVWVRSTWTREVSDFLVFAAVLMLTLAQFTFFAAPAMLGSHAPDQEAAVPLIAHLEVAVMFAAAAVAGPCRIVTRKQATVLLATPVLGAAVVAVGALLLFGSSAWFGSEHAGSTTSAQAIALAAPAVFLMLLAAVGFVRPALRQRNVTIGLPGAAAVLLAAAWSYSLLAPGLTANSVSGRECLCAGAFGLILLFAINAHARLKRVQADEAIAVDRRRLICDLHDGMAQDLAFIAIYAESLVEDFGPEHPLTVAARRALAASRGFIANMSASDAPNAAAALRAVADELSARHGVRVTVEADGEDLTADKREAVVRIAREAIVNAVKHGDAKHVAVSLETRDGHFALRIKDDGRGLGNGVSTGRRRGFGLRAMRERTEAIGGELSVGERPGGGTAVEAVIS